MLSHEISNENSTSSCVWSLLSGNTFNNLSLGGQNYDGLSAVTPLEYLIVEAGMRAQTPQPTLSVLYDEKMPEDFLMKAAACTKLGMGYPAWMNNQVGMNFMIRQYGPGHDGAGNVGAAPGKGADGSVWIGTVKAGDDGLP